MMKYLEGLNEQQEAAVWHKDGPLLILAGAGSGKTRVITCRIAHLINYYQVKPWNILAITFTNKAAREMKERVSALLGEQMNGIWIYTFHAACIQILRQHIDKLGFDRQFLIFDSDDRLSLIKDCLKALNMDTEVFPPKMVINTIGRAKDNLMDPDEFESVYESDYRMSEIGKVYRRYQETLKNNNALDFDDIIMYTIRIFRENEDVLEFYSRKFKYIMVDEYQDTNRAQFVLVSLLAKYHRNLCVVGDDDQSIYGWRGADISNILDFEKIYPDCRTIKLERNYRSTDIILEAANQVIKNNKGRKHKKLWTDKTGGEKIVHMNFDDERKEADFIVNTIERRVEEGGSYGDFAVLYRVNAQSRAIEDAFVKKRIPYKMYGGIKFYERKEIKDLLAYLRLLVNVSDNISFKRVINVPKRGIGKASLDKLEEYAQKNGTSMFLAAANASSIPGLGRAAQSLEAFTNLIYKLLSLKPVMDLSDLVEAVIDETEMEESYRKEYTQEAFERIENLREFITAVMEYEAEMERMSDEEIPENADPDMPAEAKEASLEDFLYKVSLAADTDELDLNEEYVTLMTLHSAKGLEFNEVFIPGFEEEIFPHYLALAEGNLEEERRLCYVGFTRARKKLYITYTNERTIFGRTRRNPVSCFFSEIPEACLEVSKSSRALSNFWDEPTYDRGYEKKRTESFGLGGLLTRGGKAIDLNDIVKPKEDASRTYAVGDRVYHKKYGEGTVSAIVKDGQDSTIEIAFDKFGMKRFLLSMVQLTKL
jgi:DNA helicase-2/ATP-dependent DNA helicase PcrA